MIFHLDHNYRWLSRSNGYSDAPFELDNFAGPPGPGPLDPLLLALIAAGVIVVVLILVILSKKSSGKSNRFRLWV